MFYLFRLVFLLLHVFFSSLFSVVLCCSLLFSPLPLPTSSLFVLHAVTSRGLIIMASTIFFPENRFYTHMTVMSFSLLISLFFTVFGAFVSTIEVRDFNGVYMDFETNMVSILFGVVDICGAVSAWQSSGAYKSQGGTQNSGVQVLFIVSLLTALLVVVVLVSIATYKRIQIVSQAATGTNIRSMWRAYTVCELIFLFPILLLLSIVTVLGRLLGRMLCGCRCCCNCSGSKSKPSRNVEMSPGAAGLGLTSYDPSLPEMLVESKVRVSWYRGDTYCGKIVRYHSEGEHAGMHECVYDDGEIKFYKIIVNKMNNMVAPNNGVSCDLHTISLVKTAPAMMGGAKPKSAGGKVENELKKEMVVALKVDTENPLEGELVDRQSRMEMVKRKAQKSK